MSCAAYAIVQAEPDLLVAETARADSKRWHADQTRAPSRDEARALLAAIYARVEATPTVRQMPAVTEQEEP